MRDKSRIDGELAELECDGYFAVFLKEGNLGFSPETWKRLRCYSAAPVAFGFAADSACGYKVVSTDGSPVQALNDKVTGAGIAP